MKGQPEKKKNKRWILVAAAAFLILLAAGSGCMFLWLNQEKEETEPVGWQTVPLVSQENRDAGSSGGEGGQWPHTLEVGRADSSLLFYGTNTGGIYRSVDGGKSWALSSRGLTARGANAFAIDPVNDQYILAAGMGDNASIGQGLYLSSDRGATWEMVLDLPLSGNKFYLDGLEFDADSFREEENRCMRAYYSVPCNEEKETDLEPERKGLYRTEDGGATWKLVNRELSDAELQLDPSNGRIYASRADGVYVSENQGEDFTCLYSGPVNGFDISWADGRMYVCGENGLLEATLQNPDFRFLFGAGIPSSVPVTDVSVSPVNPKRILVQAAEADERIGTMHNIYYTEDRGRSWNCWTYDESRDFFPYLSYEKVFAWSYAEEHTVWSFGGEHVIASTDGGQTWTWSSEGICGVLCGGKFHFNIFDSDLLFFGAQDLNGALTTDGGQTWTYMDVSGNGGWGHVYGGYAADREVFWGSLAPSWDQPGVVTITFDGGKSYVNTGKTVSDRISNAELSSYQAYNDLQVYFAGNYRSSDGGRTWTEMTDCLQVYTHNPQGEHELYGCENGGKGYVLVSYDNGETWSRVNKEEIPLTSRNHLSEVQIDAGNQMLYAAANGTELYRIDLQTGVVTNLSETLPADEMGKIRVNSIAVDERQGRIYVAGCASNYNRKNTLLYSQDGGNTWEDAVPAGEQNGQIVEAAMCLAVNPETGELWSATACHGFVKYTGEKQE